MTLFSLLTDRRDEILLKCREKADDAMGDRSTTLKLDKNLPRLYQELLEVLRISLEDDSPAMRQRFVEDTVTGIASRQHAQEAFRLGYTVSQLVHGYGCICQGITEFAHDVEAPITSSEFGQLNLCLDVAIAQAVSEFERLTLHDMGQQESLRLGFLAHELRNSLSNAMMAHELIRTGGVGIAGATSTILVNAHLQMKNIIDRAMVEVRMSNEPSVSLVKLQLFSLMSELESSALSEAKSKAITLHVKADPVVFVNADRHLMASAVANLIQNAIKFTPAGGNVWVRAFAEGVEAVIEVEDQCGGLPDGKTEELFKPFTQEDKDKSGIGLGLPIARRAIQLNRGTLKARNLAGKGCMFNVRMPKIAETPAN